LILFHEKKMLIGSKNESRVQVTTANLFSIKDDADDVWGPPGWRVQHFQLGSVEQSMIVGQIFQAENSFVNRRGLGISNLIESTLA
jgi:hypothetical protein